MLASVGPAAIAVVDLTAAYTHPLTCGNAEVRVPAGQAHVHHVSTGSPASHREGPTHDACAEPPASSKRRISHTSTAPSTSTGGSSASAAMVDANSCTAARPPRPQWTQTARTVPYFAGPEHPAPDGATVLAVRQHKTQTLVTLGGDTIARDSVPIAVT